MTSPGLSPADQYLSHARFLVLASTIMSVLNVVLILTGMAKEWQHGDEPLFYTMMFLNGVLIVGLVLVVAPLTVYVLITAPEGVFDARQRGVLIAMDSVAFVAAGAAFAVLHFAN